MTAALGIAIRAATADDVEALVALVNLAYRVEDFFIDGDRTDAAELRGLLAEHVFLVAVEEGGGGGLAAAVLIELREGGARGYFGMLSVDPARQGMGLGRRMVGAAEEYCRARGCRRMELQTVSLRTELPPFYERLGYVRSGTKEFPDIPKKKRACHFVLMEKVL